MVQKSLNENIKAREKSNENMTSNIDEIDELLDDEGWDLLNSLTEDELAELNSDFDPENQLIPTGERINHQRHIPGSKKTEQNEIKPMFSQKDLKKTLDAKLAARHGCEAPAAQLVNSTLPPAEQVGEKTMFDQKDLVSRLNNMVEQSQPKIQNERIRQKEEERKKKKEEELDRKFKRKDEDFISPGSNVTLTAEEEELLADATEEELIEAAALLNMNDILTSEQINAVFAGDKPVGGMSSNVKGTLPKQARISKADEETDLDIVVLNRNLKNDTADLFYLCVNNQPKLEKQTLELIISAVANSKNIKHLSLSMIGLTDKQCIALAEALSTNEQIETINLDSNIIGMPGIEALMNVLSTHPTIREFKCSNQKQPFGGQGEDCMANAIVNNSNILKFGYSFKQAAPRNKADRGIIRNNEILRQRRRNGEETYDLKAVCKVRDPWPQPWIKVKGQRLLSSQLESKVTDMGLMIDPEADVGRESRGPKVREEREAKPLDIAALLAARANKLKGSKVAELDKDTEERRKKTLLAMKQSEEESGRVGTMLKKGPTSGESDQNSAKKGKTLNSGANETAPPAEAGEEEEVEDKSKEIKAKKKEKEEKERKAKEGEAKKKEKEEKERKAKEEEAKKKEKEEEERKAREEEAKQKEKEEKERKAKEEEEKKNSSKKIASLAPSEDAAPIRRRKPKTFDEEPEPEFLKPADEPKKEEPEKKDEPSTAAEERAQTLKERREALAAKKASAAKPDEQPSAAERAKTLKERREALAAKKAGAASDTTSEAPLSAAEEGAGSLKERREELAKKKAAINKPTEEETTSDKPKVDVVSVPTEDKPLSLKERRALLAEKKRLMGK